MMWLYPTSWLIAGVYLIQIGERSDALGAILGATLFGIAAFVKEFDQ